MKKFIIAIAAVFAISANAQEHKADAAHHDDHAAPAKAEKKAKKAAKKEAAHAEAAHGEKHEEAKH
jgi:hypothetical protein